MKTSLHQLNHIWLTLKDLVEELTRTVLEDLFGLKVFLTEYSVSSKTYGGKLRAKSWEHAERRALKLTRKGTPTEVVGVLTSTKRYSSIGQFFLEN